MLHRPRAARPLAGILLCAALLALPVPLSAEEAAPRAPDAPYVPSQDYVVRHMLEVAEVGPDDFVMDLGSGDGRMPIAAARDHGARGVGIELAERLIEESRLNAKIAGVEDRVEFRQEDLFQTDISDVTVLMLYLLPRMNEKLRPRILSDMAPGTRVIAHQFGFGNWVPERTDLVHGRKVMLWIVPAHVEGRWRVKGPDEEFEVEISQTYQEINARRITDERPVRLPEASVRGPVIRLAVPRDGGRRDIYVGHVNGDTIEPAPKDVQDRLDATVADWSASRLTDRTELAR